jgi:protein-L-isoaspartate(D-aspartate) O-methyltransferase
MLALAELESGISLLELGAGSGWNASLAGFIIYPGRVLSLDIVPQLVEKARENLNTLKKNLNYEDKMRLENIEFKFLNIFKQLDNWQELYDRIVITAGINKTQEGLITSLAEKALKGNGILICPYTQGPMIILKKKNGKIIKNTTREQYVFVPLLD